MIGGTDSFTKEPQKAFAFVKKYFLSFSCGIGREEHFGFCRIEIAVAFGMFFNFFDLVTRLTCDGMFQLLRVWCGQTAVFDECFIGGCMAFGTLVVALGFCRMLVPDRFMNRVVVDRCFFVHRVLVFVENLWVTPFAGGVVRGRMDVNGKKSKDEVIFHDIS